MLIRLIYTSTAYDGVDADEFKRILVQAQTNNLRTDLTGMLVFNSKTFLQAIEGAHDVVNKLYARIVADPRHHTVTLINYSEITERNWPDWSMGFAAPNPENKALFLKYSTASTFGPYGMCAQSVERLMMELSATVNMSAVPKAVQR